MDRQQVNKEITMPLNSGDIWESDLFDVAGKEVKTIGVYSEDFDGVLTVQASMDRQNWYDHPSSDNPVSFTAGTMATITMTDVLPYLRTKIVVSAAATPVSGSTPTNNVKLYYIAN